MCKIPYLKKVLTVQEQIELLKSRGITFSDLSKAEIFLKFNNYYFISGYIYHFELKSGIHRTHKLKRSIDFSEIIDLINFDNSLRLFFFKAITLIEISLRAVIARELAFSKDLFCLTNSNIYKDKTKANNIFKEIEKSLKRREKEPFIKHYIQTYIENYPPSWITIEIISFGTLSKIYANLLRPFKKKISTNFNMSPKIFVSWLKTFTELRNVCAHHARLWNRAFVNSPNISNLTSSWKSNFVNNKRLGVVIPIINYMLTIITSETTWSNDLLLLLKNTKNIQPYDFGLKKWWN